MATFSLNNNIRKPTTSPRPGMLQVGLDGRRGDLLRADTATLQIQEISGRYLVAGNGQTNLDVNFPITFVALPSLSFGAAVDDNDGHGLSQSNISLPVLNVMVRNWVRFERLPGIFYYKGANLAVVVSGSPGYVWVHWQATGKAFRNPSKDLGTTKGGI